MDEMPMFNVQMLSEHFCNAPSITEIWIYLLVRFREFNPNQPRYGILYFLRLVYSDVISFV